METNILETGLTLIPTPKNPRRSDLRHDMFNYHRRLKLLDHFGYDRQQPPLPFVTPSNWEPNLQAVSIEIQNPIKGDIQSFHSFNLKPNNYSNISGEERTALTSLTKNQDIIIKSADKGGQVCIQDKVNYCKYQTIEYT